MSPTKVPIHRVEAILYLPCLSAGNARHPLFVGCLCMHVFLADVAMGEKDEFALSCNCLCLSAFASTLRNPAHLISIFSWLFPSHLIVVRDLNCDHGSVPFEAQNDLPMRQRTTYTAATCLLVKADATLMISMKARDTSIRRRQG